MAHDDDSHDDHHDDGYVPLYCPPIQRQKWGEAQIQPHSNWGDTFFDLFYVAAAYNLGNLLRTEPTSRGILYFVGCFFPIQVVWNQKMYHDARYWLPEDAFHRLHEFAILMALGTAVLYIRPVSILSDPKNNIDMFVYSLATTIATILSVFRAVEVYFNGVGQPAMKSAASRDILWGVAITCWYIAATIASGIEYYGNDDSSSYSKVDDGYDSDYSTYDNSTDYENEGKRYLAGSSESSGYGYDTYENNVPIWLVFGGAMTFVAGMAILVLTLPGGGKHKAISVPMNVTFGIHRWGEFTMLMLGESVLSLLIVDVTEDSAYYKTFFCGIISITLLEYLHFRSQPHDADDHALRRSKEAGVIFSVLMQVYSAALVVLGTSYKMLLYEYVYEAKETGAYRMLTTSFTRFLAGSDEPLFEQDERRQRVARFFGISMAIVWLCSDIMIINHRGLTENFGRCKCSHSGKLKFLSASLLFCRVGLVAFIATVGEYVTNPSSLAFIGMLGIIAQVALRVIGSSNFGPEFSHDEVPGPGSSALWPNVTKAQVASESSEKKG